MQRAKCNEFWKLMKSLNPKKNPCHWHWEEFQEKKCCMAVWETISTQSLIVSTQQTFHFINALRHIYEHNDIVNVYISWRHYIDWRDNRNVGKQFRRQSAVGKILISKFPFEPIEAKIQLFNSCLYPINVFVLWCNSSQLTISKLNYCPL